MVLGPQMFQFHLSHEVDEQVSVSLGRVRGCLPQFQDAGAHAEDGIVCVDVYLEVSLALEGRLLDTQMRSVLAPATPDGAVWDSEDASNQLKFAVKIDYKREVDNVQVKHLLSSCMLGVTAWAQTETGGRELLGGCAMPLFSKKGRLKTGLQQLTLWPGREADVSWPSSTPGKVSVSERGELGRLEQKVKQYERGDMARIPWLDAKALNAVCEVEAKEAEARGSTALQILFQLPRYPFAVLYSQPHMQLQRAIEPQPRESARSEIMRAFQNVSDPEVARGLDSNPSEYKALKLSRAVGRAEVDREAKPNKDELMVIHHVLSMPPTRPLSVSQKTLISKFRYYLAQQPNTIVKFLKSIDWTVMQEATRAVETLQEWQHISVAEALQMLTQAFGIASIRKRAVEVLQQSADDDKLEEVMVQLVQCVRYDGDNEEWPLADFLVRRCHRNVKLAVALHWSLIVGCEDAALNRRIGEMIKELYKLLAKENPDNFAMIHRQLEFKAYLEQLGGELSRFAGNLKAKTAFMRSEMSEHGRFGDWLSMSTPLPADPNILLRAVVPSECKIFKSARAPVLLAFKSTRQTVPPAGAAATLETPLDASTHAPGSSGTGSSDGAADRQSLSSMREATAEPGTSAQGTEPGHDGPLVRILYKQGDDLRQDQFVCQLIRIMDNLLKRENLDLRLTPYWVLPTTADSGILEFVPSVTLQDLTGKGRLGDGILKFLAERNSAGAAPSAGAGDALREQVHPAAMDNFIRSNAGYAIISYLLDMGDRHLENLLLTDDGKLFHIDFGYVFGMRDPKSWAKVPVSIKRDIVAAMGGQSSPDYTQFRQYAAEAYCILRKHAGLFLTLLSCMAGSEIQCFSGTSTVSLEFATSQLEERLTVDMSDEEAMMHMFALIDQSVGHMLAPVGDTAHRIASNLR